MRLGSPKSPNYSNGLSPASSKKSITNGHASAANGASNGTGAVQPSPLPAKWFDHDREEVARILIQSLTDLGYHRSARTLSEESGFELEGPEVAAFRHAVLHGEWAEAEGLLFGHTDSNGGVSLPGNMKGLTLAEGANQKEMLFWLRQQKYLELLENEDVGEALRVLRQELTPLSPANANHVPRLSSLLMCKPSELKQQAEWDGANGTSRAHLLSELSKSIAPSTMIPEHRLAMLLHETKEGWIHDCLYHNTYDSPSLYLDHLCDRSNFPSTCIRTLADHDDEVWFLAFSNNGKMLATAGKDRYVYIYDVENNFRKMHVLADHTAGVCHVAWSPDDTKIITCCREPDSIARVWNVHSGSEIAEINHFQHAVSGAAWAADSNSFVIGSQDCNTSLSVYRLPSPDSPDEDCDQIYNWSRDAKMRVYDVALSPDGRRLVALLDSCILVYDFFTRELIGEYPYDKVKLTSVKISEDNKHMLVSMNVNQISVMVMDTGEVRQTFHGHKQANYMIRSVFGGANESFVVSGSEDSAIYIWRRSGPFVEKLDAHLPGCVNAVAWHPTDPRMFASAGDDKKVKIWTPGYPPPASPFNNYIR